MDFLNPKKKRAHRRRLLIGYFLVGLAIAVGTVVLILQAYGFDINRKNGQVIQNGLVFVDSKPVSGDVYLNGKSQGQTKQKLVIPAGQYDLEIQKTGYRTWKRSFSLGGGAIERMEYPFLFPTKLTPKDVQLYAAQPALATNSPDRRWLVVQQPGKTDSFDVVDLNSASNATTTITIPTTILTSATGDQRLELVEWSTDNRHLLLKHSFTGGLEFIVLDRENAAQSVNLSKQFKVPFTKVSLHDKQPDEFYLLDGATGTLRLADLKNKSPAVVLEKVLDFHPDGTTQILYVTETAAQPGNVLVRLRVNASNTVTIRQISKNSRYLLDMAKYDNHWYIVFSDSISRKAFVYKDPQSFAPKSQADAQVPTAYRALRLDVDAEFVSFSANAQFIALQGGSKFAVYDLENNRQYRYDSQLKLPAGYKVTWMDGHRLAASSDGVVVVFEYDNQNRQILVSGDAGIAPFFDRNYEVLYTIGSSAAVAGRQALTRSDLVIK